MNKLIQLIHVIGCWHELEKLDKKEKGPHSAGKVFNVLIAKSVLFLVLAFGIILGWVKIPTWLGDGYSYDNF